MTQNQLTAVRNAEIERNNKELERLRKLELAENMRHSTVTELETRRHNVASEEIDKNKLAEQHRSNLVQEQTGIMNATTNARNAETNRRNAQTNYDNASTNRFNALISAFANSRENVNTRLKAQSIAEDIRHNQAVEAETRRNNDVMNDISQQRANIERRSTDIKSQLAGYEAIRVNQEWERIDIARLNAYTGAGSAIMNGIGQTAKVAQ